MPNTALQRENMVESQIRPSDVTDRRITAAMGEIAREAFLPEAAKSLAYMDDCIEVAPSRRMHSPRTFARLLQLAAIEAGDRVLDVGAATGYSSAVIGRLAQEVVALEQDSALAATAKSALAGVGAANVSVVIGELASGHKTGALYDVIVLEGAVDTVPASLVDQLGFGGRLVAVESKDGLSRAVMLTRSPAGIARRIAFDAAAPKLPGFEKPKTFVF